MNRDDRLKAFLRVSLATLARPLAAFGQAKSEISRAKGEGPVFVESGDKSPQSKVR